MADITKRTNKRAAAHLEAIGERAEVVLLCEVKGTLGVGAIPTAVMPRTMTRIAEGRASDRQTDAGGLAAQFPAETTAVALTPSWFVAMPSNGIRFDAPTLVVERFRVLAELEGQKGLGKRMALTFSDGSQVRVDVGALQPLKRFVELLGGLS